MQLEQPRLKIKRANKHIADIEGRVRSLSDSDRATVEINPVAGNEVIKHDITDTTAATDIALMFGDAVHNLKCALDYAWLETISRLVPSAVNKFTKFPVYPSRNELEVALRGKKIDACCPALFNLMITEIRPYNGGNFAIWPVHRLDIRDKHRLIIPVIYYSSISGIETQDERGEVQRDEHTLATVQEPPYYIHIPIGRHVKNCGKVATSIMFEDGIPGRQMRMLDSFSLYSHFILQIVEMLENV